MLPETNKNNFDLLDIFLIIWNFKIKIILITISTLFLSIIYYTLQKPHYSVITPIKTISIIHESKYDTYNRFVDQINKKKNNLNVNDQGDEIKDIRVYNIQNIDKDYLLKLFIDQFKEKEIIKKLIKDTSFLNLNQSEYSSKDTLDNEISKLASSVKLIPPKFNNNLQEYNDWKIEFSTANPEKWYDFLNTLQNELNKSVNIYLRENLEKKILNEKNLNNFLIEDLDKKLSIANMNLDNDEMSQDIINDLLKQKIELDSNSKIEKISFLLNLTPLNYPDIFLASTIDIYSSEVKNLKNSGKKTLTLGILIGLILGIFVALINHGLVNRKNQN